MTKTTLHQPDSTANLWEEIWRHYIAALRAGHRAKAAELKQQVDSFDADVLGLGVRS